MPNPQAIPLVLVIGGHDPSGGAGIQADIEAIAAHSCQSMSVITALTTQNTCGVLRVVPQPAEYIDNQCRLLLEESEVAAVKLGLLGNAEIAITVNKLLDDFPHLQVILDPVLSVGYDGAKLVDAELQSIIWDYLCPRCLLMTPNSPEARILGGHGDLARCADNIIVQGCAAVLVTGTHELSSHVTNSLYSLTGLIQEYKWPRLSGGYHGSGCTLASAIAANVALGCSITAAVEKAQIYTWNSLKYAIRKGKCQFIPNRLYVTNKTCASGFGR
ncbi:hypothetical protein TI04_01735 [Achromatium sp. WMS2]|nr:hypothetical protein TI04_01735 [Achromatium sp. WMS2]